MLLLSAMIQCEELKPSFSHKEGSSTSASPRINPIASSALCRDIFKWLVDAAEVGKTSVQYGIALSTHVTMLALNVWSLQCVYRRQMKYVHYKPYSNTSLRQLYLTRGTCQRVPPARGTFVMNRTLEFWATHQMKQRAAHGFQSTFGPILLTVIVLLLHCGIIRKKLMDPSNCNVS